MRILTLLMVLALSGALHAQEFKPYARSKVTQAEWERYFERVKSGHGASARELGERKLIVFSDEQTSTFYAFTQPGHPAHPAWVTSRLARTNGEIEVRQIGYFAGDRAAFEALFREYVALNNKLKREVDKRSANGDKP
jgi:hypothetical protein